MFCNQCEQTRGSGCVEVGVCGKNADVQSLQEILLYGLKGMAAYAHHARRLGATDESVSAFIEEALFATMTNVNARLGAKDIQSLISLQKQMATPSIEQGMAYSRNVIAIAADTKGKIAKEVEVKVADTNAKVSGLVEKALQSAPAGSEVAVAAVKTAMKTANEAYEGINKAAKQAADVAEASVAAVTEATMKAANVTAPKAVAKKAA